MSERAGEVGIFDSGTWAVTIVAVSEWINALGNLANLLGDAGDAMAILLGELGEGEEMTANWYDALNNFNEKLNAYPGLATPQGFNASHRKRRRKKVNSRQ